MKFIIATNNEGKVKEFERILLPLGIEAISQKQAGFFVNPQEDADSFEGNALIKAKTLFDVAKCSVIADDSGLEVDALNKAPGVYTARYGGEGLTDKERYEKILEKMKNVKKEDRRARFVCAISLVLSAEKHFTFTGICEGEIGFEASGKNGFGYDPIFYADGESFANMDSEKKDLLSHRGKALREMARQIKEGKVI